MQRQWESSKFRDFNINPKLNFCKENCLLSYLKYKVKQKKLILIMPCRTGNSSLGNHKTVNTCHIFDTQEIIFIGSKKAPRAFYQK